MHITKSVCKCDSENYGARCIPVAKRTFFLDFLFFLAEGEGPACNAASMASLRFMERGAAADSSSSAVGGGGGSGAILRTRHVPLVLAI